MVITNQKHSVLFHAANAESRQILRARFLRPRVVVSHISASKRVAQRAWLNQQLLDKGDSDLGLHGGQGVDNAVCAQAEERLGHVLGDFTLQAVEQLDLASAVEEELRAWARVIIVTALRVGAQGRSTFIPRIVDRDHTPKNVHKFHNEMGIDDLARLVHFVVRVLKQS